MLQEVKFAELLCTRLCHDLTGPIGALANGAEFLSEEGFEMQGQAIELIASSAAQAVARLQFYRRAYGRINDSGEASLSELKSLVTDYLQGSKVTLDWPDIYTDAAGVSISYKMSRVLLNTMILSLGALLRGGTIAVRLLAEGDRRELNITATGSSIKLDALLTDVLSGKVPILELTPKTIQAELTRQLANEIGATLQWNVSETELSFKITRQSVQVASGVEEKTGE
jgi:histidine phosphotransferase ChpT